MMIQMWVSKTTRETSKALPMAAKPIQETLELGNTDTTYSLRDFSSPMIDLNGKSIMITGGTGSFGNGGHGA